MSKHTSVIGMSKEKWSQCHHKLPVGYTQTLPTWTKKSLMENMVTGPHGVIVTTRVRHPPSHSKFEYCHRESVATLWWDHLQLGKLQISRTYTSCACSTFPRSCFYKRWLRVSQLCDCSWRSSQLCDFSSLIIQGERKCLSDSQCFSCQLWPWYEQSPKYKRGKRNR